MPHKKKKIILLIGDIFVLYLSLYLSLWARFLARPASTLWHDYLYYFSFIFLLWILIFYISNLYHVNFFSLNLKFFQTIVQNILICGSLAAIFFYLIPYKTISPKSILFLYLLFFLISFIVWRRIFQLILGSYLPKQNIIIIGFDPLVQELIQEIQNKPQMGYRIVLLAGLSQIPKINGVRTLSNTNFSDLRKIIAKEKVSYIILNSESANLDEIRNALFDCLFLGAEYINIVNFYESIAGKIALPAIDKMWFLEHFNKGELYWFSFVKRIFDFSLAIIILVLTLPVWPLIAICIKIESRGTVFFQQMRTGKNKRKFNLIKFRTMREEGNNRSLTINNDPRITRFGRFLRITRIDEIPQVINILKGEMSFVGPRPERPIIITKREKEIPFYNERLLVHPGITGWDQVSGEYHSASREDTLKKLQYDLFYIKNRSLFLDFSIMLKTIAIVLGAKGR